MPSKNIVNDDGKEENENADDDLALANVIPLLWQPRPQTLR